MVVAVAIVGVALGVLAYGLRLQRLNVEYSVRAARAGSSHRA
jgi:hypothetical protein